MGLHTEQKTSQRQEIALFSHISRPATFTPAATRLILLQQSQQRGGKEAAAHPAAVVGGTRSSSGAPESPTTSISLRMHLLRFFTCWGYSTRDEHKDVMNS